MPARRDKVVKQLDADISDKIAAMYGSVCYVCGTKKGLTYHHRWYNAGDAKYSDFPRTVPGRRRYTRAVQRQVLARPYQFYLLCSKHHHVVESMLRWSAVALLRLEYVVSSTATAHGDGPGAKSRKRLPNDQVLPAPMLEPNHNHSVRTLIRKRAGRLDMLEGSD